MKESADLVDARVAHLPAAHVLWEITAVLAHEPNGNALCPRIFAVMIKFHSQKSYSNEFSPF